MGGVSDVMADNITDIGGEGREAQTQDTTSRSTAACNGCRVRKQKCDGERPICLRCRSLRQECEWPKAQKRGPAKGYTEAVEARLQETEKILIWLLSTVPREQMPAPLSLAFAEPASLPGHRNTAHTSISNTKTAAVQRKAAIEYWNSQNSIQNMDEQGEEKDQDEMRDLLKEWQGGKVHGNRQIDTTGVAESASQYQSADTTSDMYSGQFREEVLRDDDGNPVESWASELVEDHRAEPPATSHADSGLTTGMERRGLGLPEDFKRKFLW